MGLEYKIFRSERIADAEYIVLDERKRKGDAKCKVSDGRGRLQTRYKTLGG